MEERQGKRIARNTVMLYVRMLITMVIGLYTSRVILNTLGVEDFGVYGVVGSIVAMLNFLNTSMSGATSRFVAYEMGCGNSERLHQTFITALFVHFIIAVVILLLAETVGMWFLLHKLVIPAGRMAAAMIVFQLSIVVAMLAILQAPFNALIFAHESMDVYAYIEILKSVLSLVIVYLLLIGNCDKLILYAGLHMSVMVLIFMLYITYCLRHFHEAHIDGSVNRAMMKPLLSFSGWDLYGNGCVAARQQGVNFLINMFFGVVFNAASSVASTVNGALSGLTMTVVQAFRPQIIKNYAAGDVSEMSRLMRTAAKYILILFGCMVVPCAIEMPAILRLWLGIVPPATIDFCRLLLCASMFGLVNSVVVIGIHATGHIKKLSFVGGTFYLLSLPIVYVIYRYGGAGVQWAYAVHVIVMMMILVVDLLILKYQVKGFSLNAFVGVATKSLLVVLLMAIIVYGIHSLMPISLLRVASIFAINILMLLSVSYVVLLSQQEREMIAQRLAWVKAPTKIKEE